MKKNLIWRWLNCWIPIIFCGFGGENKKTFFELWTSTIAAQSHCQQIDIINALTITAVQWLGSRSFPLNKSTKIASKSNLFLLMSQKIQWWVLVCLLCLKLMLVVLWCLFADSATVLVHNSKKVYMFLPLNLQK